MSMARIDQPSADALIMRMARGEMAALEELYNAMYREIYCYLYSLLNGDRQGAEDLAQDTFIRVYKYAPKFAAMGSGRSWVYRIAGRLALNHFGNHQACTAELSEALSDRTDIEEAALDSQMLAEAMASLSPEERQVVSLHAVSGLSLREIAGVLGQPLGTVKWRHAEAIKKLRKRLNAGNEGV